MNYWDSSAVVALIVEEDGSADARDVFRRDRDMAAWWGTPVECHAAIRRRERGGAATADVARTYVDGFSQLFGKWVEIGPAEHLRLRAQRLLAQHPLRAADALQLAAALDWADEEPFGKGFVCLDDRLRESARREGFNILPAAKPL